MKDVSAADRIVRPPLQTKILHCKNNTSAYGMHNGAALIENAYLSYFFKTPQNNFIF